MAEAVSSIYNESQYPNINEDEIEKILETSEYPDLSAVYSNEEEERIRKNKFNNKNIVEMDHGNNKSAISRHNRIFFVFLQSVALKIKQNIVCAREYVTEICV
ncbi:hypothetical protein DBV15_07809 [Temnothorax longispinosus]|uniref:Uncharacterized protein n=1 Tax=Temnothorax longispinosus TaxID=300112 RepID=A0A4S2K505_9HYME|nr:hypothetical protein DBV15_07809 [Temnothorax longispinosus]